MEAKRSKQDEKNKQQMGDSFETKLMCRGD